MLTPEQKQLVRHHVADNSTSLGSNPLFLTLLCRFVRQNNRSPVNDHNLLEQHVTQLAHRDPDYVQRRYHLRPEQLVEGATRLAVLFAENPSLSLAPTYDQIRTALPGEDPLVPHLEDLIAALVEVKIGRCDVAEARIGDRRFSFSHRRYQETLFVSHLAMHSGYLPPRPLLTDIRWREYTVTFLQTQPADALRPLCEEAALLLDEYARQQNRVAIRGEFGGHLHYYEWDDIPAIALLRLLQEGLARRRSELPRRLFDAVEAFLGPRWREGDFYDQCLVIELGGLLPLECP